MSLTYLGITEQLTNWKVCKPCFRCTMFFTCITIL